MFTLKISRHALALLMAGALAVHGAAEAQSASAPASVPAQPVPKDDASTAVQDNANVTILAKKRYSFKSAQEELSQTTVEFACAFLIQNEGKSTGRKHSPNTRSPTWFAGMRPVPAGPGATQFRVTPSDFDGTIAGKVANGDCNELADDPTIYRLVHSRILQDAYTAYEAKDYAKALPLFEQAYNEIGVNMEGGDDPKAIKTENLSTTITDDRAEMVGPNNTATLRALTPVAVLVGRMYLLGQGTPADSVKAIEWLKKAALAHYTPPNPRDLRYNNIKYMSSQAEAAVTLAGIYQAGAGVPASPADARKWYMRAADLDYFPAVHICGQLFRSGYGGEKNIHTAVTYFTRAGTAGPQGYAPSQYALGEIYYNGEDGIPRDKTRAGAWLLKAAKNGYPDAQYAVGRMYELGEGGATVDPVKTLVYYKDAAVKGQPDAEEVIGLAFYTGQGVPKDLVTARRWFLKASEDANPDAMFDLAVMMVNGEGGPKDLVKAYAWFYVADKGGVEKAAAAMQELAAKMTPDERAQADALLNPKAKIMTPKSLTAAAAAIFLLSAGQSLASPPLTTGLEKVVMADVEMQANAGNGVAQWELGRRYYYFKATKDDIKALHWFEKAAQQGVPWAEYETATMYELGEGGPADSKKAFFWYQKSATDGIDEANADLGMMYMEGDGVAKDVPEAIKWLQKGVDVAEPRAETLLGQYYRDGTGVPQDVIKARSLLKAAVKQKHANAATVLEVMYQDGKGVPADPITAHAWRTMAYFLKNIRAIQAGGNGQYAILYTPNLNAEDNLKAWKLYQGFMLELGLATPDKPGPNGSTPETVARDYFNNAANRSLSGPYK